MEAAPQDVIAWDLTSYFSAPEGEDLRAFLARLEADVAALAAEPVEDCGGAGLPRLLTRAEDIEARLRHLSSYVYCVRSAEPGNNAAEAAYTAEIRLRGAFDAHAARLAAALGALDEASFASVLADPALAGLEWRLRRQRAQAAATLSAAEEQLAGDLLEDSLHGWSRLADKILEGVRFEALTPEGAPRRAAFAERYDFFWRPEAQVRRTAYAGLKAALADVETVLAACLNGMTGARLTLLRRRGLDAVADVTARMSVDRSTIEAMMRSVYENRGRLHRYLRLKAQALGLESLEMPDRWAPVGDSPTLTPGAALDEVTAAFQRVCRPLAGAVGDIRSKRWIDYRTGPEKTGGGFCVDSPLHGEPRVHLNVEATFMGQTVLAHELGHAFHFMSMRGLRPWLRLPPSTLAETASIAAEHLFRAGALAAPDLSVARRLEVLGSDLDAAVNYLLRIPRDFDFERALYDARADGELTAEVLKDLARRTHARWFEGVWALDGEPYAWCSPLTFSTYTSFFNLPYTFGYLLGRAIADLIGRDGEAALDAYIAFLRKTGAVSAEEAAASALGLDLSDPRFWSQALASLDDRIDAFERLSARLHDAQRVTD